MEELARNNQSNLNLAGLQNVPHNISIPIVSQMLVHASSFLNRYTAHEEEKLVEVEKIVGEAEILIELLEAKLDSLGADFFQNLPPPKPKERKTIGQPSAEGAVVQAGAPPPPPGLFAGGQAGIPPPPPINQQGAPLPPSPPGEHSNPVLATSMEPEPQVDEAAQALESTHSTITEFPISFIFYFPSNTSFFLF